MRINRSIISNQTESVPVERTLTINGTTYDLTANRSWTVSGGGVTGSGTTNYLSKWTSGSALGDSAIYETSGNIIIGNTANRLRLTVSGLDSSSPTLGTASGTMLLCNSTSTNDYGMMFGISPTGSGWIQQQRVDASATAYDLHLQPSGGNVGIATSTPGHKLDVSGLIRAYADATYNGENGAIIASNATNLNKRVFIGYDGTVDAGFIQSVFSGTSYKPLLLNPTSGNVIIGSTTDSGDKLQVNGAIKTAPPTGYTAEPWKLGDATSGTITPDYYIKVEIDGQIYSIPALLGVP